MEAFEDIMRRSFPDGKIGVKRKRKKRFRTASGTNGHESKHGVVAIASGTGVVFMTNIPGPGYKGLTQLESFNAAAAMAPDADGDGGTGHDVAITERAGANVSGARATALHILTERKEEVNAVAEALGERGTLNGSEIKKVMEKAREPEFIFLLLTPQGAILDEKKLSSPEEAHLFMPPEPKQDITPKKEHPSEQENIMKQYRFRRTMQKREEKYLLPSDLPTAA